MYFKYHGRTKASGSHSSVFFSPDVAVDGEVGGNERDGDAYYVDGNHQHDVTHEITWVEECQVELLVEDIDGDPHQYHCQRGAYEAVDDASPKEWSCDESHFGTYHTHGAYGVAVGENGDAYCCTYECDRYEQQQNHEDDEEP